MKRDYFTCTHRIVLCTFWNQGQVLTNYQVSIQWWVLKLFLQNKPAFSGHVPPSHHQSPSLSSLPLPWVLACTLIIVICKWQRVMHEPETCMTLDSQSFLRLYLWANWRTKGTFFCIIYRYFWLSMLVPSFFMCSCTHVLLLSMVQQRQANPMLLLCSKFTCFKLVFVDLWLVL